MGEHIMAARAIVPFLVFMMLLTGVCNTLLTKYQDNQCVADCDSAHPKTFEQPVLQTLQMFIGESGCWLIVFVYAIVKRLRTVDFTTPAQDVVYEPVETADPDEDVSVYDESQTLIDPTNAVAKSLVDGEELGITRKPLQGRRILLLALPAICDILGTTLMNAGLLFVAASIYQMTRGALVLFVGLFSVLFLKRHLSGWKWASLFTVVLGVAIVGLAAVLDQKRQATPENSPDVTAPGLFVHMHNSAKRESQVHTPAETILGITMIAGAQIITASQFVIEESIMEQYSMQPIQVVGWEGVFGFIITSLGMALLHAVYGTTDAGRGGYFDTKEGFRQMFQNRIIAITSLLIMISIGGFNFFGLSVTRTISATSRSTIDTFRTLFIWLVSLGLGWETFKWLQVLGFALLVWGTAIFNDIVQPPTIHLFRRTIRR